MKVAIVHDFLNQYGGAERVVEAIKEIYPEAPVFTSIFEPHKLPERMRSWEVYTPQFKIPFFKKLIKYYTFLLPLVFENFDLHDYDVIISSTANFAKGVITRADQLHICYCHTPPRFLYHYETEINRRQIGLYKPFLIFLDHYLRIWDYLAAQRVNHFITNALNTQKRIAKFYRRDATVIYPPVEISQKSILRKYSGQEIKDQKLEEDYFLIVSRLAAYKKVDLAIQACNRLKLNLKIIGVGREEKRLKKISGSTISFLGQVEDCLLADYWCDCQAVIFPGEDDFGMVPVEAMSYGKPVIAYGKGGALESVVEGKTGEFFLEATVESLEKLLKNFNPKKYKEEDCIKQAGKFSKKKFKEQFIKLVTEKWKEKIKIH